MEQQEILNYIKNELILDSSLTDSQVKNTIYQDYLDLLLLRNNIADSKNFGTQEDTHTIDHILDYMELFMEYLKINNKGGIKNECTK